MILVTGATGTIGRPLVDLLLAGGAKVRVLTRRPPTVLPDGVEVAVGDAADPDSLGDALSAVTSVFLNPRAFGQSPDPQTVTAAVTGFLRTARDGGADRVVALSALNVDHDLGDQPSRLRGEYNKEVEAAAVASGLEWTALRCGYFAVNTITSWARQIAHGDQVVGTHPDSAWAPLHERDIAAVAAHALLTGDLAGRRPVLTGPRSLTQPQMVAAIGTAIGRPLHFTEAPVEAAKQGMIRSGMPAALAEAFLSLQARSYLQPALVTDTVEQALGRPGLSFDQWAAEHVAEFTA